MGGGQSLNFGLKTKPPAEIVPDLVTVRDKLKLLWLSCSNKDNLFRISQDVHNYLKDKNVPHVWYVDSNANDGTEGPTICISLPNTSSCSRKETRKWRVGYYRSFIGKLRSTNMLGEDSCDRIILAHAHF